MLSGDCDYDRDCGYCHLHFHVKRAAQLLDDDDVPTGTGVEVIETCVAASHEEDQMTARGYLDLSGERECGCWEG